MSGNMSSLNDLGRSSRISRGRSSMLQSFLEEEEETVNYEDDKDFWGNRLVLGALADIVFSELPHPKLSPQVIDSLQRFLVSVNITASHATPFVQQASRDSPGNAVNNSGVELSADLIESLTPEAIVVLRSLICAYFRRQVNEIWSFWRPILVGEGHQDLPESPDQSCFQLICEAATGFKEKCKSLDTELDELGKKMNEEMMKLARDAEEFKRLGGEILKERSLQESSSYCAKRLEYLKAEKELLEAEETLEKLKLEEQEYGTEQEQRERAELYNLLNGHYQKLLAETEEMEEKVRQYKALGQELQQICEEKQETEEQIQLKEWVLETLRNGPKDESLLNDTADDIL